MKVEKRIGKFDYIKKLYEPIKMLNLYQCIISLLHDTVNKLVKTKKIIRNYNLGIAEVSLPAIRAGIELDLADY